VGRGGGGGGERSFWFKASVFGTKKMTMLLCLFENISWNLPYNSSKSGS